MCIRETITNSWVPILPDKHPFHVSAQMMRAARCCCRPPRGNSENSCLLPTDGSSHVRRGQRFDLTRQRAHPPVRRKSARTDRLVTLVACQIRTQWRARSRSSRAATVAPFGVWRIRERDALRIAWIPCVFRHLYFPGRRLQSEGRNNRRGRAHRLTPPPHVYSSAERVVGTAIWMSSRPGNSP